MSRWEDLLELAALETDECVIWPHCILNSGYGQVYCPDGKGRYAHRLALLQRSSPPEGKPLALHGPCNNRACMNYRHLYWGNHSINALDRQRDGTQVDVSGERNPMAKLTDVEVAEIRRLYEAGLVRQSDLATRFGVDRAQICLIVHYKSRPVRSDLDSMRSGDVALLLEQQIESRRSL